MNQGPGNAVQTPRLVSIKDRLKYLNGETSAMLGDIRNRISSIHNSGQLDELSAIKASDPTCLLEEIDVALNEYEHQLSKMRVIMKQLNEIA